MKISPFSIAWIFAASIAFPFGLPTAGAASLYWDGSSSGPNADGGAGTWSTAIGTINWDTAANGGSGVPWTNGSSAVFAGAGGQVTVSGNVSASSLSFQTAGYSMAEGSVTLTGTPVIDVGGNDVDLASSIQGTVAISKTGGGTLTLSGANTFSGTFNITEGIVKISGNSPLGAETSGTIISAGATLDLNTRSLSSERITFSGAGVNGAGAIVNNGTVDYGSISWLKMAAAATIGASKNWDIGPYATLDMGGHTLTKTGSGEVRLLGGVLSPGKIDIREGTFSLASSYLSGTPANVLTTRSGTTFGLSTSGSSSSWTAEFETDTIWRIAGGAPQWRGAVNLSGITTLDVLENTSMTNEGVISGPGSILKTGDGTWVVDSFNTHAGGTIVNAGKAILNAADTTTGIGAIRNAVTVNGGGTLELARPGSFGSATGATVNRLDINGGLVDNTSDGGNTLTTVNLAGGTLRSGAGVNDPSFPSHFDLPAEGRMNSLSSETTSFILGRLNFSGGESSASTVFDVGAGGATEDLRISAVLTESTSGHSITKTGAGTMTLDGQGLHTGNTVIESGTMLLATEGDLQSSPVKVNAGGRFGTLASGKKLTSLTASAESTLIMPATPGNITVVTGELNLTSGDIHISPLLGAGVTAGIYDLVSAGSITGSGIPRLNLGGAFGPTRASGSVAIHDNKLRLTLSKTGGDLIWNNASSGGAAAGLWNNALPNFSLLGNNEAFQAYDSVTFNDSVAPGTAKTIALGDTLAPALLTVDNSNGSYTFDSSGGFAGPGSLVKTGTSSLTIGGTDSFAMTGNITAGGGILDFSGKTLSAGHLTVSGGGEFNNATATFESAEFHSGRINATLTGNTSWTKATSAGVELSGNNELRGNGTILEGTLVVGNAIAPNKMGSLGTGQVNISKGASITFCRSDVPVIANTFSGAGELKLAGTNHINNGSSDFSFSSDNSGFSGPLTITNARLKVSQKKEIGSSKVTLIGNTVFSVADSTLSNTIRTSVDAAGPTSGGSILALLNAELAGPLYMTGNTTTSLHSSRVSFVNTGVVAGNLISGPIHETGGSASLVIHSIPLGNRLTLSGHSTYTGATIIQGQSTVNLTGSLGPSAVNVQSFSTLEGSGTIGTGGSLTFNNRSILKVKLTGGGLTVNGNLNLGPSLTVSVDAAQATKTSGPVPILNYTGTLTGTASQLVMDAPYYRQTVFDFRSGQITLDIGRKDLIWNGTSGSSWEVGGAKLWNTTGIGETDSFYVGDSVLFDDTGSNYVRSSTTMTPSSVVFNNNSKDYVVSASFGGPCKLTKRGTGDLIMVSGNSHTGGTIIEAGRFEGQSTALGNGPVLIGPAATLAGDFKTTGEVTIVGTLDPGISSQTWPATLTMGPTTLAGKYVCQLDSDKSDTLAVTGDLNLTGSSLMLNQTSSQNPTPELFTIATYTGGLTGRFGSVSGMPAGFTLLYDAAGKRIIITPAIFDKWVQGFTGLSDSTPNGDPDGDGIPNLIEFVLAGNPGSGDHGIQEAPELNGSNLLFRYKRSDASVNTTSQTVQWSSGIGLWNDIPVPASGSANVSVSANGDLPDDITVTIPRLSDKMFVRLKVTKL